jgi:predicted transcriptional regulator
MESINVGAVKEPKQRVLLRHVFGISQTGLDICIYVMDQEEATPAEIARALDINRSTATRQLNQLRNLGVMDCREESLAEGGRIQIFSPVPMAEIRQRHRESLLSWATEAIDLINELDRKKLEAASTYERAESSQNVPADE